MADFNLQHLRPSMPARPAYINFLFLEFCHGELQITQHLHPQSKPDATSMSRMAQLAHVPLPCGCPPEQYAVQFCQQLSLTSVPMLPHVLKPQKMRGDG